MTAPINRSYATLRLPDTDSKCLAKKPSCSRVKSPGAPCRVRGAVLCSSYCAFK